MRLAGLLIGLAGAGLPRPAAAHFVRADHDRVDVFATSLDQGLHTVTVSGRGAGTTITVVPEP